MNKEMVVTNKQGEEITVYQINNDVNGNPRYVIHFLNIADNYDEAKKIANNQGAAKYRAKWFGGGFVFTSYNIQKSIDSLTVGD